MQLLTYWSNVITSCFFVCALAKRNAKSFASEPELTKKHTFKSPGKRLERFAAQRTSSSCKNRLFVDNSAICFEPAATTCGWQCPTMKNSYVNKN